MRADNELTGLIIGRAIAVHRTLGPGLLEGAYAAAMFDELTRAGLCVDREVPMPLVYRGLHVAKAYKADLIVERRVLVELKSLELLLPVHKKQLLTYLRLSDLRVGLLLNFGASSMRDGIVRAVHRFEE